MADLSYLQKLEMLYQLDFFCNITLTPFNIQVDTIPKLKIRA